MTDQNNTITIKVLDRDYKVKCPTDKVAELQKSALHLDTKMREIRDNGKILSIDRIAVIAALNVTHEMLQQKQQKNVYIDGISQRIQSLQNKIENALADEIPAEV